MAKTSTSKAFATAFIILTVSVIGSIVTMIILYKTEIATMNPTPRPTLPSTTAAPPPVMRLPTGLVPDRYTIFLQTHFYSQIPEEVNVTAPNQTMLFTGNSSVAFHCVERTRSIYLHSRDLTLGHASVKNGDTDQDMSISHIEHHAEQSDFLEIGLKEALEKGSNYSLFVSFQGQILDRLQGLYVSTYSQAHTQRFLASTNLEPTSARRVFPCFDEPQMKAVFDVSIVHRLSTTALGNAEVSGSDILPDDWQLTRFHPTPKMSTYLLAFMVSELTSIRSAHRRVNIQIYARPEATEAGHTAYAANVTGSILDFYEKHFHINYPQKKLDQVALPDLSGAAKENWGLITYAEGVLLYQTGVSSLLHKETISYVIAHQLAHQWFGNLVTMTWWSEVWLKEGFATYMASLALDHLQPTFQARERQMMTALHVALKQDALASSHPLAVPHQDVQSTSQILDLFDAVTSYKGAMLLTMLADAVEPRVFNKGIQLYLRTFKYDNAEQNDLWDCIQKAVDEEGGHTEVATLMATWTKQIGYPVVTINTTNGELYQRHFLYNTSFESSLWWYIPIRVMSATSETSLVWLESDDTVKKDQFISTDGEWILANVGCTGYYRVNYDPENWDRLLTQLESNPRGIPVMNRGQLIDDAFNLARANIVHVTLALNATRFLRTEEAYIPWQSAIRNLEYFVLMFDRSEVYGPMQAYLRDQVQNLYGFFRNLTDESDIPVDHSSQHHQITAIDVACSNGLPECVEMATMMFADWMSSSDNQSNRIHPNLRSVIYCQAVAAGGEKEWEFAWNKFQSTRESSEKEQLRQALSCTRKIWLLSRYLQYTLDPEKVRLMDVTSTINFIARNVVGHGLAWNFLRAHWDYISQGDGAKLIDGVTRRFSTPFELEELENFASKYDVGPCAGAVERAIERTKVNIQWVADNKETVLDWFERRWA
ncbi:aminopeptidase N-like isoform X2 [Dunckerocampus dactyliophorus]|uniref:aminopeptidase N-like isoform X2 n=1 Tax=Dunckerocampus dactyliophorus TaxID=161453 RepID=UPI002404D50A|nr:aminopeptidase N-like isoform X2 [Dunckerocampus dactyliophorus]